MTFYLNIEERSFKTHYSYLKQKSIKTNYLF